MRGKRPLIDNGDGTHSVPTNRPDVVGLIDSADAELVGMYTWCAHLCGSTWRIATRTSRAGGGQQMPYLYHVLIGRPIGGLMVDHVNRDALDNRRANLRLVTSRGNNLNKVKGNSSGCTGLVGKRGAFEVYIWYGKQHVYLGRRKTAEEAGRLYDTAVIAINDGTPPPNGLTGPLLMADCISVCKAFKRRGLWELFTEARSSTRKARRAG